MSRSLTRENDLLASELGRSHGHPVFQWCFSENLWYPMRKHGEFDYKANEFGIIEAHYKYELRKMAPYLDRQWVVCRWLPPHIIHPETGEIVEINEDQFQFLYGKDLAFPRNGYYAPTNAALDPDIKPWDTNESGESLTVAVVGMLKKEIRKTFQEHLQDGEDIIRKREAMVEHKLDEEVGALLLNDPFGQVCAGSRAGGVSIPTAEYTSKHDKAFEGAR